MKKKYIIPQLQLIHINCETLIAESLGKYSQGGADEGVVLVKGDNSSSSSSRYNVWDDDWSAE